jgi:hypothetical protein
MTMTSGKLLVVIIWTMIIWTMMIVMVMRAR